MRLPVLDSNRPGAGGASSAHAQHAPHDLHDLHDQHDQNAPLAALARDLAAGVNGDVRFGLHDRMLYSTDASLYQVEPLGVVIPRSVDAGIEALRIAAAHGVAVLPRGGGTALAGQTVNRALVVDFSAHCRRVHSFEPRGANGAPTVGVEPGVVLDQLNAEMAPHGVMFGPDVATSSHATLGGMIGNNSAGAWSILYGRTVEHLLGMDVVLADGRRLRFDEGAGERDREVGEITRRVAEVVGRLAPEIRRRFPKIKRHVDGYNLDLVLDAIERSTPGTFDRVNLAKLVCGSEGTLATVVDATLGLVPRPKSRGLAIVGYATVDDALNTLKPILATDPAAVELVDDVVISMALANAEYRRYVEIMPQPREGALGAVLYVEYFADDAATIQSRFAALRELLPHCAIAAHSDAAAMAAAWKLRKAGEPLLHGVPGLRKPITFVEDTAVDPLRLPEFVREFRAIVEKHGTTAAYYAHASVGCLHIRPLICLRDAHDLEVMQSIAGEIADLVSRYDGALSGEHGDGRVRSPFLERYFGRELCDGFREIKAIFDPKGRMNPGNIVAPDPMVSHLRVRPHESFVRVPETATHFRYEREHGFDHAVDMCNGAGICRRLTPGGTMCPSYRVLLDERHATRGRGNALRLAISGQLSPRSTAGASPSWSDPETLETLRLCLSCKACKTECPSNVDISKLKAEYLAQHHQARGGPPLAARVFAGVRSLNRVGSACAPLANAVNGTAAMRWLASGLIGFDSRRSIPRFGRSLHAWMRSHSAGSNSSDSRSRGTRGTLATRQAGERPTVLLFPDCFTVYNEPHIGRAAIQSLEALGYHVVLPDESSGVGCCGRSAISVGMLDAAATMVGRTSRSLLELAERHRAVAIVGCEPSCVSAIKDEWLELRLKSSDPSVAALRDLAAKTMLVEEFIDRAWDSHPAPPSRLLGGAVIEAPVLLHAHCHQKALWGAETSARLLRRLAGSNLSVLATGCCGMAGSFGYMKDRYDLSMAIGEQELFPAVRSAPVGASICAPGTSCRHQIHDGTGATALHPIELFARAVSGG